MSDPKLKSAYELAMERFAKKDAEAGIETRPLTDAQKAEIADIRTRYQAKIAELEILHQGNSAGIIDPLSRDEADANYRQERGRLERERDSKVEAARSKT